MRKIKKAWIYGRDLIDRIRWGEKIHREEEKEEKEWSEEKKGEAEREMRLKTKA